MFKKISKLSSKKFMSISSVDNFFVNFANKVIDELNTAIDKYQVLRTEEELIDQLKKINGLRKQLEDMCPQDIDVHDFAFKIQNLFIQLVDECDNLGIEMVDLEKVPEALQNISFVRLQANMHPAQLEELFEILYSAKKDNQGKLLWNPDKWIRFVKKYPEFNGYDIKCCSAGNAKNFMLTSLDPNTPQFMLRLDDRLGGARTVDSEVRKTELARFLTPIAGTRLINSKRYDSEKKVMEKYNPTLLITTVCPNGTPLDHARKNLSLESKIEGATKIYGQMSYIFSRMQAHNIFCPDGKNENWLINDKNLLCVADNKSWLHSQDGYHDIDKTFLKNSLAYGSTPALITSYGFTPSYINDECFEIDQMHCFILGNNMYQYLTGCSNSDLEKGLINFELPIFQTPDGELFAKLIKDCRDGTTTVLTVLDTFFAKDKEYVALSDLERIPIINGDNLMKSWINAKKSKLIEGVISPEERTELGKNIEDFIQKTLFLPYSNETKSTLDVILAEDAEYIALSALERIHNINDDNEMMLWINSQKLRLVDGDVSLEDRKKLAKKIENFTQKALFLSDRNETKRVVDAILAEDAEYVALSALERIPLIHDDNLMKSWINMQKSKLREEDLSLGERKELANKIRDFRREASFLSDILKQNEPQFLGAQQQKNKAIKKAYHEIPIELRVNIMKVRSIQRALGTLYTVFGQWSPMDFRLESNLTFKKYKEQYQILVSQSSNKSSLSEEGQLQNDSSKNSTKFSSRK